MFARLVATVITFIGYGFAQTVLNPVQTIISGQSAGMQFDNSNTAYVANHVIQSYINATSGWLTLALFVVLFFIWVGAFKSNKNITSAIIVGFLLVPATLLPTKSYAYYDKQNWTENVFIGPNESAFWVPDVGANKDSQAKFGSEDYYRENKIPAKRFEVPHTTLQNSGAWSNYYVPAGKLIKVDRTPQSREWTDATDKGSSNRKEGFSCQSAEGINIRTGITIGVFVTEEQAPRFLYHFGTLPLGQVPGQPYRPIDQNDPVQIFQAVLYGQSLAMVTDGVVRNKVESLVCDAMYSHNLDDLNANAATIMSKDIFQAVQKYLDGVGISLDYIGFAEPLNFDDKIQDSINRKYVADKDAKIADELKDKVSVLQAIANADATRAAGEKWNGSLPGSLVGSLPAWMQGAGFQLQVPVK